jgi:hypothetical protein
LKKLNLTLSLDLIIKELKNFEAFRVGLISNENHISLQQILSTRFLGKKSNLKLKTVTIIHSATTETVRLPDDNNGVSFFSIIQSLT